MSTCAALRDRFAILMGRPSMGAFSARRTARAEHLLEVRGVGPIARRRDLADLGWLRTEGGAA
jgi:hypothetical protein